MCWVSCGFHRHRRLCARASAKEMGAQQRERGAAESTRWTEGERRAEAERRKVAFSRFPQQWFLSQCSSATLCATGVTAQHVAACRSSACRSMPQLSMSQLSMSQHVAACRSSACRRSAPLSSFLLSLYLSSFSLAVPSLSLALALTFVATPKMITRSEAWTREQFDFVPRRESVRGKR